jgi:hypothetical protein
VAQFNEKVFRVGKGSQRTDSRGSPQLGFYPLHPARGGRVKTGLSGFLNSVPRRGNNRTWSRGMVHHQNCQISGLQVNSLNLTRDVKYPDCKSKIVALPKTSNTGICSLKAGYKDRAKLLQL